ncbi:MAG: hypothetical protein KAS32_07335 [Candidatus Peribacteraceae bacterium]|nr:hypothetical protein [Candidatus Peribacteraceae bacterium]
MTESVQDEFRSLGFTASRHYADDAGKEWAQGDEYKNKAVKLFDEHPELESELREIAKEFLWSINVYRPTVDLGYKVGEPHPHSGATNV